MTKRLRHICVFCGSSRGSKPAYKRAAQRLGALLASEGITLVYGGGNIGLMGDLADAVMEQGGRVIGVIPRALADRELAHTGITDLRVVASMHQRKQLMSDLAEAFIALPGGIGTLEETFEILTWTQLGIHQKPIGLLNVSGYYNHIRTFLDHMVAERFISASNFNPLLIERDETVLLKKLKAYKPHRVRKWISRSKT